MIARVSNDLKDAMKARDRVRIDTLRMLKSRLQEAENQGTSALTPEQSLQAVARYGKQLGEAIAALVAGGRTADAERVRSELRIVEAYLPVALSDQELAALVDAAILETGATSPKEMGRVMQAAALKAQGRADGKRLSAEVRARLSRTP
jgi:uncharacterized protein YqeY